MCLNIFRRAMNHVPKKRITEFKRVKHHMLCFFNTQRRCTQMVLKVLSYLNRNNYINGLRITLIKTWCFVVSAMKLKNVVILVYQRSKSLHSFLRDFLIGRRSSKNFKYTMRVIITMKQNK